MAEHCHIVLEGIAQKVDYESSRFQTTFIVNRGDELSHSTFLGRKYCESIDKFTQITNLLPDEVSRVEGAYLSFKIDKRSTCLESFDSVHGAKLMNIRGSDDDDDNHLTVFLPEENEDWLLSKLSQYDKTPEGHANRKNLALINSISDIECADLSSFFTDSEDYNSLTNSVTEYEVWIDKALYDEAFVKESFQAIGVTVRNRNFVFNNIIVYLVESTRNQLIDIIHSIEGVSEIRIYRRPSVLTNDTSMSEQDDWIDLINSDVTQSPNPSRVAILDSGVNQNHPLLQPFLPEDRSFSVTMNENKRDFLNHGTGLASLVLYGDLTDVIYQHGNARIFSDLTSVKMIPGKDEPQNEEDMFAAVTEDAITKGRNDGAQILCSAVTSQVASKKGQPSSTSSAIDQTLYNDGKCDSLMFISGGNVSDTQKVAYPDYLSLCPIDDPAQAWNVITVGAYTEKVAVGDQYFNKSQVIAPAGGISPFSRSSVQWGRSLIKPEIVMEGGNGILNGSNIDTVDDLSLVCADSRLLIRKFTSINATSAATALAARLAGKIKERNPQLSPLSIRALIIHSAEWTDQMIDLFTEQGKLNKFALIHTCGYGVPVENKALASNDSYVTFIAEDTIKPFSQAAGTGLKFSSMNIYELPWPKETLLQMGETQVTLKITLSYYICPCPGARSMLRKYTYQSLRLNFDVNGPTEDLVTFENRIRRVKEEGNVKDPALASRWTIGIQTRNQGSIISDKIENITAAQLASCNKIAIYPSGGWFKNYDENEDMQVKYSLVVSIETPEQEIFEEIATKVGIVQPVMV